jgi:hypothetical protein
MPKIRVSMPDLQRRALQEMKKQPGCHDVQEIAINRVAKHDEYNWSLCVLAAGAADANTAARAAVHVQTVLRRDYDLLTVDLYLTIEVPLDCSFFPRSGKGMP